jgi:hypothetical protein
MQGILCNEWLTILLFDAERFSISFSQYLTEFTSCRKYHRFVPVRQDMGIGRSIVKAPTVLLPSLHDTRTVETAQSPSLHSGQFLQFPDMKHRQLFVFTSAISILFCIGQFVNWWQWLRKELNHLRHEFGREVIKKSGRVGEKGNSWEKRLIPFWIGERAPFCWNIPKLRQLHLRISVYQESSWR